jgi:hypothetical protein
LTADRGVVQAGKAFSKISICRADFHCQSPLAGCRHHVGEELIDVRGSIEPLNACRSEDGCVNLTGSHLVDARVDVSPHVNDPNIGA